MAKGKLIEAIPTLDTNAYASGDQLGTLMTLTGASNAGDLALLESITIVDLAGQSAGIDVLLFDESPTIASSNNAAANIADAEMSAKCIGVVKIASADYSALSANSVVTKTLDLHFKPQGSTLYALAVVRGTPTYAAASLIFKFCFKY